MCSNPKATLPVCLDLGTDNESCLSDPLYVGVRKRRIDDKSTEEFVEIFMREMHKNFPNMIIQFEDFATSKAFPILHKHRDVYPCFNDDIQGTVSFPTLFFALESCSDAVLRLDRELSFSPELFERSSSPESLSETNVFPSYSW